jgi:hypothetical protein
MSARVPPPLTWHICRIIVDYLGPIVSTYILNQLKGHWLLSDALKFAISMEEDGNVVYELSRLASNIRRKLFMFWILLFPF